MKKGIDLICSECEMKVDIMSVRKIDTSLVKIMFICPYCGRGKTVNHYLYDDSK